MISAQQPLEVIIQLKANAPKEELKELLYVVLMKNPLEDSFSKLTQTRRLEGVS